MMGYQPSERVKEMANEATGYIDDRGELIAINWEQYQYFLWHGLPKGVEVVKTPECPAEN
jgi:hypothetical protein